MNELDKLESIKADIISNIDHSNMLWNAEDFHFGMFVLTGPIAPNFKRVVGYVVQVRKKWGAFGSDAVFIRASDDKLMVHENQCFWAIAKEQENKIKPFFLTTPNDELKDNPELIYTIKHKQEEKGFIVSPENAPARCDSFAITITSGNSTEETR